MNSRKPVLERRALAQPAWGWAILQLQQWAAIQTMWEWCNGASGARQRFQGLRHSFPGHPVHRGVIEIMSGASNHAGILSVNMWTQEPACIFFSDSCSLYLNSDSDSLQPLMPGENSLHCPEDSHTRCHFSCWRLWVSISFSNNSKDLSW